jgi:cytoskeletal protein CcmA (bactofilin family)
MNERNNKVNLTIIGEGMQLTGELWSADDIRIDGKFIGELETEGKIVISEKGLVKGNVKGYDVTIYGNAEGDFEAKNNFNIGSGGYIEGSVKTKYISIRESAYFNGTCNIFPQKENHATGKGIKKTFAEIVSEKSTNREYISDDKDRNGKDDEKSADEKGRKNKNTKENNPAQGSGISLLKNKISQIQSL